MHEPKDNNSLLQNPDCFYSQEKPFSNQSFLNRKRTKKAVLKEKIALKHLQKADNNKNNSLDGRPIEERTEYKQKVYDNNRNNKNGGCHTKVNSDDHNFVELLNKIMHKPAYLRVIQGGILAGNFGHATAVFKRPILEGHAFIQFKVKEDFWKDREVKNSSSVRFGLCINNFNIAFPIGRQQSLAYKSSDGSIYYKGQRIHKGEKYGIGDTIGIYVSMSAPCKHRDINEISENSKVLFFKNGGFIYMFEGLKQTFYCFSVSLYNYSKVQILSSLISHNQHCNTEYTHYYDTFKQKIAYKDLDEKGIFKI